MTYGWAALGFCVLAAAAGIAFAAARALAAWRDLRSLRRSLAWALVEVGGGLARAERNLARLPARLEELARAQARLEHSLGRARLLRRAAQDALSPAASVRRGLPRKQV